MPFSNLAFSSLNATMFIVLSICLYFALSAFRRHMYLWKHGVFAEGRTIGDGHVRFMTDKGFTLEVYYGATLKIGVAVGLLYDPLKPSRTWVAPSPGGIFTTTCCLIGSFLWTFCYGYGTIFPLDPILIFLLGLPILLLSVLVSLVYIHILALSTLMKHDERNTLDTQAPHEDEHDVLVVVDTPTGNKEPQQEE